jgi:hypothetical protein
MQRISPSKILKTKDEKLRLPAELDNDTVIFSYGSLLNHEKLRYLLKTRGEFKILETSNAAEAAGLCQSNPKEIVILRNVCLENVRVSIVTEMMLRRWYKNRGGDLQELIDAGVTTREMPPALFLYARPAKYRERGKILNGGLICNLGKEELSVLDKYEWEPVLKRLRAPKLKIRNDVFIPKHIVFYAGIESTKDIPVEEKAERARLLNLNRKPGHLSPQARWQTNVRRKE